MGSQTEHFGPVLSIWAQYQAHRPQNQKDGIKMKPWTLNREYQFYVVDGQQIEPKLDFSDASM